MSLQLACSDSAGSTSSTPTITSDVRNRGDGGLNDAVEPSDADEDSHDVAELVPDDPTDLDLEAESQDDETGAEDYAPEVDTVEDPVDVPDGGVGGHETHPEECLPTSELSGEDCTSDADCGNDAYCDGVVCVFYPSGRRCSHSTECLLEPHGAPPEPSVQCRYHTPLPEDSLYQTTGVVMSPLVADLDLDGTAEIIFVEGSPDLITAGYLTVINGTDCEPFWESPPRERRFWSETQLAVADLNGDGYPEIVGYSWSDNNVVAVDRFGELVWQAMDGEEPLHLKIGWGGASIADLDQDGSPELIFLDHDHWRGDKGVYVLRSNGELWWKFPMEGIETVGTALAVADVDGDGEPEIMTGNRIVGPDGSDETPEAWGELDAGHVAVADFSVENPGPEIAVSWTPQRVGLPSNIFGGVRILTPDGQILLDAVLPGYGHGGPPNVADFDGDGRPEFGVVNAVYYAVIDLDCVGDDWEAAGCEEQYILWKRPVQDGSGSTAASAFDFGADGRSEILYADECFFRIMDGANGHVLATFPNTSGTTLENPVVADVDGDFNTEIVLATAVVAGIDCEGPPVDCSDDEGDPSCDLLPVPGFGITVLHSYDDLWVNSRAIWNQHAYHITNIEDDGTVPTEEADSWDAFNSYRRNAQVEGKDLAAPDLTIRIVSIDEDACPSAMTVNLKAANRGSYPVGMGVPVRVLVNDTVVCETETTTNLWPGEVATFECRVPAGEHSGPSSLRAEIDGRSSDDSSMNSECEEDNNWAEWAEVDCF